MLKNLQKSAMQTRPEYTTLLGSAFLAKKSSFVNHFLTKRR